MQLEYKFSFREKDKGLQVILAYKDAYGKWKQKSKQGFKGKNRRTMAKLAGDRLLEELKETVNLESSTCGMEHITLLQLKELFLRDQKNNLEYNTRRTYDQAIDAFNDIASMAVTDITFSDIMNNLNKLSCRASTKQIYMSKIKRLFKYAISPYKLIKSNPAAEVSVPKDKERKKIHALSKEELKTLLSSMRDNDYIFFVIAAIAGYAGLRYGEIIGLTWDNVNLKEGSITVCQQWGATDKNEYGPKSTKSINGNRIIPIPEALIEILQEYQESPVKSIDKRLFMKNDSHTISINYAIRKVNKEISIHDLRHTYATQLLANGVDIRTVAALVGDTVETVIHTYVHYTDEMRKKAKEDINKIFSA